MTQRKLEVRLLILPLLLSVVGLAGCRPESLVSESQEISVGRDASRQIESRYRVSTDAQLNALVNNTGQYLAARSQRPNIQYTFKVLEINEINAVALPGGWIYVYRGLIDAIGGPNNVDRDMLAAVLAHEVGHVAARHHAEMMGRSALYGIGIGVLTRGNTQQWVGFFANLNLLSYSRGDEYESDQLAIRYTYGSRYDPRGMIRFLQFLEGQQRRAPSTVESWFRTHPTAGDRVERAQNYLNELRAGN